MATQPGSFVTFGLGSYSGETEFVLLGFEIGAAAAITTDVKLTLDARSVAFTPQSRQTTFALPGRSVNLVVPRRS